MPGTSHPPAPGMVPHHDPPSCTHRHPLPVPQQPLQMDVPFPAAAPLSLCAGPGCTVLGYDRAVPQRPGAAPAHLEREKGGVGNPPSSRYYVPGSLRAIATPPDPRDGGPAPAPPLTAAPPMVQGSGSSRMMRKAPMASAPPPLPGLFRDRPVGPARLREHPLAGPVRSSRLCRGAGGVDPRCVCTRCSLCPARARGGISRCEGPPGRGDPPEAVERDGGTSGRVSSGGRDAITARGTCRTARICP